MYCTSCGAHNDDNNFRCIQCSQIIQGGAPGVGAGGYGQVSQQTWGEPSKADTALIVSLLGFLMCQVLSIWGWVMARDELRAIDEGRRDPSKRSTAQAAWWLSVIAMVLFVISLFVAAGAVVFVLTASPNGF